MGKLILGHGQHGKDTVAELMGLKYKSSSEEALRIFLFDRLNEIRLDADLPLYSSQRAAYEDRYNNRKVWYDEICEYNRQDPARLAKGIMSSSDCYVGMRSNREYLECIKIGLFDEIYWVDASERKPMESSQSMNIEFDSDRMVFVDNNGTEDMLQEEVNLSVLEWALIKEGNK